MGNYTETDVLAIRHRHSREITGDLHIANDDALLDTSGARIDFVIAEVKTGAEDRPNKVWRDKNVLAISYVLRFAGFIEKEETITSVAEALSIGQDYIDPNVEYRARLVVISEIAVNKNWKQITNISIDHIIDFLINVRGNCWVDTGIGIASFHDQWEGLIKKIFDVANDHSIDANERKAKVIALLND